MASREVLRARSLELQHNSRIWRWSATDEVVRAVVSNRRARCRWSVVFSGTGVSPRTMLSSAVAVAIVALALTVGWSDARFADATSNIDNSVVAGRIDIELPTTTPIVDGSVEPGSSRTSCVELTYVGDIVPAEVRLAIVGELGEPVEGVTVAIESRSLCRSPRGTPRFDGSFGELLRAVDWSSGIGVWTVDTPGETIFIHTTVTASVGATGGPVSFVARFEARPGVIE